MKPTKLVKIAVKLSQWRLGPENDQHVRHPGAFGHGRLVTFIWTKLGAFQIKLGAVRLK